MNLFGGRGGRGRGGREGGRGGELHFAQRMKDRVTNYCSWNMTMPIYLRIALYTKRVQISVCNASFMHG